MSQLGGADLLATGRENLILQGRLYGGDLATVTTRAEMLMQVLDLGEFADRRVRTYSGGQRRRLDVALGIVHEPDVSSSWTSPARDWTRRTGRTCGTTSAPFEPAAPRSFSPPTT